MKTTALILLSLIAFNAEAKTLGQGRGACVSADLFDQFTTAVVRSDDAALGWLLTNGCFMTSGGQKVTVIDTSWGGISHVRAYTEAGAVEIWTYMENIID